MKWDDIKVFIAIAENGSLAGAARRLSQNHSTVFRRLNSLEEDLETRLFERLSSGYVLTPVGEKMLALSRQVDDTINTIYREIAGQDVEPQGRVVVTTASNLAQRILPAVINELRATHPGIQLEVSVGDHDYDMNRREADIAIRATTNPPENLIGKKLADLDWWFCLARNKNATDVSGQPLIGANRALMRVGAYQWLESHHASDISLRANDISTMAAFVKNGVGMALLPSDHASDDLKRVKKIKELGGQIWILTHPDLRKVRRIQVVWDAISKVSESLFK